MSYSAASLAAVKTGIELAIPHEMSTAEWAETYRIVNRGSRKGRWSNDTVPFLTEIMAAADDPMVREIVLQKSSQIGGSEVINNILGKRIHLAPTEMIYCAEKEDKATAWTQESFDSMVRVTPELKRLISDRPEGNNQKYKAFPGGGLYIVWATSPAELSSRPAQIICYDEKAAYKPTKEGDPTKLGEARQKTYDGEELSIKISTPRRCECTTDNICGDISHDWERGDRREYYVPCPHCDEFQTLKFGGTLVEYGLKWDGESPEMPYYLCEHCAAVIEEFDREDMLAKGYWRAANPFFGIASFKINQLYSPFVSWGRLVVDFLEAKKSLAKLEVLTNTVFGETWRPVEQVEYEQLNLNCESYTAAVPDGVLVLTAGVDVQKDRLECEVVGWGRDHESWSIEYKIFEGPTGIEPEVIIDEEYQQTNVWAQLKEFLMRSFIGEGGQAFRIQCACIDSGYQTTVVYNFVHKNAAKRWFAVKGMSDPFKSLISKPTMSGRNPKIRLFPIGTNAAKDEVFSALRVDQPGPGYCHFPDGSPYDDAYFKQLCSERMVTHLRGGRPYRVYEKVGVNIRNEALDVRVYALAARAILNPNYEAIAKRRLQHGEAADRPTVESGVEIEKPPPPEPTTPDGSKVLKFPKRRFRVRNNPFG